MVSRVQSHYHEGSPMSKEEKLRWEGFVEKVGFEPPMKEWWMLRVVMMTRMGWQVNEEVNPDRIDQADEVNLEVRVLHTRYVY